MPCDKYNAIEQNFTQNLFVCVLKSGRCPDAIAIIANLSKHLRYISSSVTYIKDHLKRSTDFLKDSQVSVGAHCCCQGRH